MAYGQLPLYHKNSKAVVTTKKRWKDYYLLVVTLFGFLMLYAGVLWFVPSVEVDDSYGKAYSSFTGPVDSAAFSEPTIAGRHLDSSPSPLPDGDKNKVRSEQDDDLIQGQEERLPHHVENKVAPPSTNIPSHSDASTLSESAVMDSANITAKRREKIVEVSVIFSIETFRNPRPCGLGGGCLLSCIFEPNFF